MESVSESIAVPVHRSGEPYVGPRSFSKADEELFFGRDREASEVCDLIAVNSIVVLHAQSGAGKSSLLSASVLPRLEAKRYHVLGIARVSTTSGHMVAGQGNVYGSAALHSIGLEDSDDFAEAVGARIVALAAARRSDTFRRREDARFVLVIDQLEELFISEPAHWQERVPFLAALARAAGRNPHLTIVLSLRDEFLASLDPLDKLTGSLPTCRYRLRKLSREAAIRAIRRPAELFGVMYDDAAIEELLKRLFRLAPREPGEGEPPGEEGQSGKEEPLGEFAEPVQLQVVCQAIWAHRSGSRIDVETVRRFGVVETALGGYYDRVIEKVAAAASVSEGEIRGWIERYLITPVRTRSLTLKEESRTKGMPNPVLDLLVSEYLLREERRGRDTWYELAHDRLAVPILEANSRWRAGQGFSGLWKELEGSANAWKESGFSSRRLLRGRDFFRARRLLMRQDVAAFGIPQLIADFVDKSEEEVAQRRVRCQLYGMAVVAVVVIFGIAKIYSDRRMRDKEVELGAFEAISKDMARNDEWAPLELLYALQAGIEAGEAKAAQRGVAAQRLREALRSYGHAIRLRPLRQLPSDVVFDGRDSLAAVVLANRRGVDLWDLEDGRKLWHLDGDVVGAQFSADSKQIAVTRERPIAQPGLSAPSFLEQPVQLEVTVAPARSSEAGKTVGRLECTGTRSVFGPARPCSALSRDFAWGAASKADGTIEVVNLLDPGAPSRNFPLEAQEKGRRIISLEWAPSAPVLLALTETHFGSTANVGAVVYNAQRGYWRTKYAARQDSAAHSLGLGYDSQRLDFSAALSPDGAHFAFAQPLPTEGRFQVLCFRVDSGATECNDEMALGVESIFQPASVLLMWGRRGTLVALGSSAAYGWHVGEDHFTRLDHPPRLNLGWSIDEQGELGVVSCTDAISNPPSHPSLPSCVHSAVKVWEPDSSSVTMTLPIPEYQYPSGQFTRLSTSLRRLAVALGSQQNPYVKIYRVGTPAATAEDDDRSTLSQLVSEGCQRLRNAPELQGMATYGIYCPRSVAHPTASKSVP